MEKSEDSESGADEPSGDTLSRWMREALPRHASEGSQVFFRRDGRVRSQPAQGLAAGMLVADYRLVSLIGQGGMGQVWEAEQLSLERRVAVKFVRPERVTERQLELFAREARAGGRLSHPGIVTIFGYGQSDGLAWIAMELVPDAWTLKDFLDDVVRAGELPEGYDRDAARLMAEIADAMQAAHDAGVIHRDLKPQNVLITSEDHPKVTDFGLARITDESALSQTGALAGTYSYMSPEQVLARRDGIDHRTDVFSLGIVLYEILALRRPFVGDTSHQITEQILSRDPPDLRTIRSRVPRDLAVIVGKALEKDRDRRYPTMRDLAADLRRHLANEPILARSPTRVEQIVQWVKRNPAKSVSAGIVAAAFTVIAVLLAANVRANESLTEERSKLAAANQNLVSTNRALETKSAESELRRIAAQQSEQQAQAEKARAERRADEVLRLSALQRLEDLTNEADRLWPAHPHNIERYRRWLEQAEMLVAELPDHEAKLAELRAKARPWTAEEQAEFRSTHPRARDLERLERELAYWTQRSAVLESGDPGPEPTAEEVGLDLASLASDAARLRELAWSLIDPERTSFGDERKGLVLARRALELAGEAERPAIRDTLAWALFALGRLDEAMAEEQQALDEAPAEEKEEFEQSLARLREAIEAELEPEALEQARGRIASLAAELAALEGELSSRPEWTFDLEEDKWWHNQLEKLLQGIHAFADEKTGLFSEGTSDKHGWGVKQRLANAEGLRAGFAPQGEYAQAWEKDLPQISAAYPGLDLTPQLGLVPIGPDPNSKLWEFAHLETGEPGQRGADGMLVLTEETGLVFVLLPGGTFLMGAQASDPKGLNYDRQARSDEEPVHEVTLSPFFLSKYEMTQGQWQRFTGTNPSRYGPHEWSANWSRSGEKADLAHPVETVSWDDCRRVVGRLGLELPSEARWEYAARAGTVTVWWTGDEKQRLAAAGNICDSHAKDHGGEVWGYWELDLDDGNTVHARVGSYLPNAFGFYDVIGNVWEWCMDGYERGFYRQVRGKDPVCPPEGSSFRVSRGGGFYDAAVHARSAYRDSDTPSVAFDVLGLRPARTIAP